MKMRSAPASVSAFFCESSDVPSLACAAGTQEKIDQLVVDLVRRQHEKAVQLLTNDREKLDQLAQYLYEKETITGEEFMKILNG